VGLDVISTVMGVQMKLWAALLGLLAVLGLADAARAADEGGATMVTVIGEVGESNRPAFDAFSDAFLNIRGWDFENAHAFDRASLAALPQATVTAQIEGWPGPVTARGPRLSDVMDAAGVAPDAALRIVALDGYEARLTPEQRRAEDWVLAIAADGEPLGIGARGPAWLLHDTGGETLPSDAETAWVWSIFLIAAEKDE